MTMFMNTQKHTSTLGILAALSLLESRTVLMRQDHLARKRLGIVISISISHITNNFIGEVTVRHCVQNTDPFTMITLTTVVEVTVIFNERWLIN